MFSLALALSFFLCLSSTPALHAADAVDDKLAQKLQEVEEAKRANNRPALADALYDAAARYVVLHDYNEAEDCLRQSLAIEETLNRKARERNSVVQPSTPRLLDTMVQIGTVLVLEKRIDEAIAQYKNAVASARKIGADDQVAALQNDIGTALQLLGRTAEAEQMYKQTLAETTNSQPSAKAILLQNLATINAKRGQLKTATDYAEQASKLLESVDEGKAAVARCTVADLQSKSDDIKGAMQTYESIIKQCAPQGNLLADALAQAHLGEGDCLYEARELPQAIEHYQQAARIAREDGSLPEIYIKTLIGLGNAQSDLEQFSDAGEAHQQALDMARKLHDWKSEANVSIALAEDYLIQGSVEKALDTLQTTAHSLEDSPETRELRATINVELAKCYKDVGQKDNAIRLVQDAISTFRSTDNRVSEAAATNVLATIYLDFGDLAKVDDLQVNSDKLRSALKEDVRDLACFDYNCGQAKLMRDKYNDAIPIFEGALKAVSNTSDAGLQSALNRGLGLAYYLSGQYDKALSCYQSALQLAGTSSSIDSQWSCNLGIGKSLKALKRYDEAEKYLTNAVALVDKERSTLTRDSFKTHNLDLRRDCFYELVDLDVAKGENARALEVAEHGKARAFLDMLANRGQRRLQASVGTGNGGGNNQLIAAAEAGSRSIKVIGRERDPIEETAISPINASAPTAEEITSLVKSRNTSCIEYLRTGDKIYMWVLNPDGSIAGAHTVEPGQNVHKLIGALNANIMHTAKSPEELRKVALERQQQLARLYQILIKPIERWLPQSKDAIVTVVPHGDLFAVPFAALIDADGNYLVEKHTLSYVPALGVLRATQKLDADAQALPHKLLAFGNPITKQIAFLGSLPYAEKEVRKIAQLYGTNPTTVEIGDAATKEAFFRLAPTASEIHLATHGLVDEERPMKSALVLAPSGNDNGLLMVRDIITMPNLKARLVVLSACETGKGQIKADGVDGLYRAFIIAGAPSILVSQWNVDDVMTEYQMSKFYDAYLKGKDKATALRDAQLATIHYMENSQGSSKPQPGTPRANPRFWAAFQLIGENR